MTDPNIVQKFVALLALKDPYWASRNVCHPEIACSFNHPEGYLVHSPDIPMVMDWLSERGGVKVAYRERLC